MHTVRTLSYSSQAKYNIIPVLLVMNIIPFYWWWCILYSILYRTLTYKLCNYTDILLIRNTTQSILEAGYSFNTLPFISKTKVILVDPYENFRGNKFITYWFLIWLPWKLAHDMPTNTMNLSNCDIQAQYISNSLVCLPGLFEFFQ